MSSNDQPGQDPLERAVEGFRRMTVPERPPDAELLARFDSRQGGSSGASRTPLSPKKRQVVYALLFSAAAAVLLLVSLALFRQKGESPESVQVTENVAPIKAGGVTVPAPPSGAERGRLREGLRRNLGQHVAEARVIVVATALDWAPAPAKTPGDRAENLIRFQVQRILKGGPVGPVITTRTPTAADEFIGKDWIVLLRPDYMAGKHQYAGVVNITLEPTVQAALARNKE